MADVRSAPLPPRFTRPSPLTTSNLGDSLLPSTTGRTLNPITPNRTRSPFGTPTSRGASPRFSPRFQSPRTPSTPKTPLTVADLAKSLILLDTDKDGKIWESDLDTVVNLAFGARISSASGDTNDVSSQWAEVKERYTGFDGMVKLPPFIAALKSGDLFGQLSSLAAQAPKTQGCLGPFNGVLQYVAMFDMFDGDNNGVICARDLQTALAKVKGREVSIAEARTQVEKVGGDKKVVDLSGFGGLASILLGRSTGCEDMMLAVTEEEDDCCIVE